MPQFIKHIKPNVYIPFEADSGADAVRSALATHGDNLFSVWCEFTHKDGSPMKIIFYDIDGTLFKVPVERGRLC